MALMPPGSILREDVAKRFLITQDGRPSEDQLAYQARLRSDISELAQDINESVEDSREKSLALTALEEALMWAGKAVFK